ncbi:MAG TPA: MlaD family protein [Actinomycetota bacterium]|nr:MlaD family protein [Actinomycetota bacterium]
MSVKNFRERSPAIVGIISMLAIAAATTFSFFIDRIPALKQAYEVKAEFKDAAGVSTENQVRVAGIKVGTVSDIRLQDDHVLITMEIDNGTEIPADAFAEIKLATLLGTKFIDLEAKGGEPYLEDGDLIPIERTSVPYEIYQASNQGTDVLEDLDGPALNDMLRELTELTRVAQDEVGVALEGLNELGTGLVEKDDELRSLLSGSEELTALLSDEGDELVRLIDASNDVLGSLARKRENLQSLLAVTKQMAGTVTQVLRENRTNLDGILTDLHSALVVLERNVEHINFALEYSGPSSRYFGSIFTQGRWADIFNCATIFAEGCGEEE